MSTDTPEVKVVLLWATDDPDRQRELLSAMAEDAPWLSSRPGFVSLALNPSLDGRRVVVEGVWESREAFEAATATDERSAASRAAFARLARLDEVIVTAAPLRYDTREERPT